MSGGHYDYLCFAQDLEELLTKGRSLQEMYDRLDGLGYAEDAAAETEEVITILGHAQRRIARRLARLQPVWKAVEWWDSSDWSEDSVRQALAEYREEAGGTGA